MSDDAETSFTIKVSKTPSGRFRATSDDLPFGSAVASTIPDALRIAGDAICQIWEIMSGEPAQDRSKGQYQAFAKFFDKA